VLWLLVAFFVVGIEVLFETFCLHAFHFWFGGLGALNHQEGLVSFLVGGFEIEMGRLVSRNLDLRIVLLQQLLLALRLLHLFFSEIFLVGRISVER
jgi:hypothetical protein